MQEYTKQHKSEPTDEDLLVSTIKKQNKEQKAQQSYEENMRFFQTSMANLNRTPSAMSLMRSESAQSLYRAPSAASIRNPMLSVYGDKEMDADEYQLNVSQGMRN